MMSRLQRYILRKAYKEGRVNVKTFRQFYQNEKKKPSLHDQVHSITRSVERLIDNGYCIGRGRRTAEKWFIDEIRLTPLGKKKTRTLLLQQPLPLFSKTYGNRTKSQKPA